jgi:hypothetical protein
MPRAAKLRGNSMPASNYKNLTVASGSYLQDSVATRFYSTKPFLTPSTSSNQTNETSCKQEELDSDKRGWKKSTEIEGFTLQALGYTLRKVCLGVFERGSPVLKVMSVGNMRTRGGQSGCCGGNSVRITDTRYTYMVASQYTTAQPT